MSRVILEKYEPTYFHCFKLNLLKTNLITLCCSRYFTHTITYKNKATISHCSISLLFQYHIAYTKMKELLVENVRKFSQV